MGRQQVALMQRPGFLTLHKINVSQGRLSIGADGMRELYRKKRAHLMSFLEYSVRGGAEGISFEDV